MTTTLWYGSGLARITAILSVAGSNGCNGPKDDGGLDENLRNVVVFQYDHVANAREIRFTNTMPIPGTAGFNSVSPVDAGFWAVFVICSLDAQGIAIQTFNYNAANFVVEYEGQSYGPLQPFKVRYAATTMLNSPGDTPTVAASIASEVQVGPTTQTFPRGFYPSLNYRIAILLPKALPTYRGEPLTLTYTGQPSIVQSRGQSPLDMAVLGSNIGSASGACRPLQG